MICKCRGKHGKTSTIRRVESPSRFIMDLSVENVVWTSAWDAKVFGLILDLKGFITEQEFTI